MAVSRRLLGTAVACSLVMGLGATVASAASVKQPDGALESCRASVSGAVAKGTVPQTVDSNGRHYQLVWDDEFCGNSIDKSKWTPIVRPLNGAMYYTNKEGDPDDPSTNLFVRDGALNIRAQNKPYTADSGRTFPYRSGNLSTVNTAAWKYGRFEVRLRTPGQQGTWPAFWMMPKISPNGWSREGEIDWFENIARDRDTNHTSLHSSSVPWLTRRSRNDFSTPNSVDVPAPGLADGFHTFAMEWDPGKFVFYVDGKQYGKPITKWENRWVRRDGTLHQGIPEGPFNRKFYLIANLAVGGWAASPGPNTDFSKAFQIDYFRVYQTKKQQAEQNEATVTFQAGGWTKSPDPVTYHAGDQVTSLPQPTSRFGSFAGWYYDPDFKKPVKTPFTITEDTGMFAKWDNYQLTGNRAPAAMYWPFRDVSPADPFAGEIVWAKHAGMSRGWPDGTFRPYRPIEREAMAAFLYRLAGSPAYTPKGQTFKDVAPGSQFYKEVEWLAHTGITTGYPDGSFGPLGSVNRDAMAAFLYRFCSRYADKCAADVRPDIYPKFYSDRFKDVLYKSYGHLDRETQFFDEIAWAKAAGIADGWSDGTFRPTAPIARNAMAAFIYRINHNHLKR